MPTKNGKSSASPFVFFTRRWRLCNIFLSLLVLPLAACHTRSASPPPPYFIVAGCMKEKLIKLFQFHFNFTRCTVLGLVSFFSLHSYLVTKAFSSDGDDGGGLCRHFSCMKIQLYALPSYTSPSLSIYIIGLYTLPVNFGQPFAGALANGNRISQAFAWPENFFH